MPTNFTGYRDRDGRTLFVKVRKEASETTTGKKTFYPVDADTGKIIKKLPDEWKTTPYNLPAILEAGDSWVVVVEGEKKAEALIDRGVIATCLYPGSGADPTHFLPYVQLNSHWLIISDCDPPGRKYARRCANVIAGAVGEFGECYLWDINPKRSDKYDIYDWLIDKYNEGTPPDSLASEMFQQALQYGKWVAAPKSEEVFTRPADAFNMELDIPARIKQVIDHVTRNGVFHNGFLDALMRKQGNETRRFGDRDWNTLWHELPYSEEVRRSIASRNYFISILESEFLPTTNPVKDWIDSLRWDGEDHIAILASALHSIHEPNLVIEMLQQWLASVIASITINFIPQGMLILTGAQGIGKSTFLRHLCPPQIRDYYSETMIDLHNKDGLECLADNIIINVSELASFQRADYNTLKGFLTLSSVKYRKSYGHFASSRIRKASFCGDTNDDYFLSDPTGNRRFWVVKLDPAIPKPIDDIPEYCGDQVWAQALALRDEILAGNRDFIAQMLAHAENFYQEPDIASAFQDIFSKPEEGDIGIEYLSATEILGEIHSINPGVKGSAISLGKEMKRMGFESPTLTKKNGIVKREWTVKRIRVKQEVKAGIDYPSGWDEK